VVFCGSHKEDVTGFYRCSLEAGHEGDHVYVIFHVGKWTGQH